MTPRRPNAHLTAGRRISALVSAALIFILLAGCWPFPQESGPAAGPTARPGSTAATNSGELPTPLPHGERELNIAGQADDPPTLDPALASDGYSLFVIRQIFGGLVMFDNDLNIVPDIAASLPSVSEDSTVYTFTLRRGVQFPDGSEVTSADFKYSLERATDPRMAGSLPPESLPAGLYLDDIVGVREKLAGKAEEISGVATPDPYTLVITIDAPKTYFLSKLTAGPAFVVQKSNVESASDWTETPKGTGPFRLERWQHRHQIVLVANDRYHLGRPKLERINIWMGANASGELQQYEMGGLDVANVPIDDLERVSDRNNPLSRELQSVPDLSVTYVGFNIAQKPFDDPKVREALSLVVDRQKIARVMFQARVRQADGFVPPDMPGYTPPEVGTVYDVTRAKELLAESTYKSAANLPRLRLYTSGDRLGPMLREVFSQTLGIELEVHVVEWTDYLTGLDRGDYPMFTLTWGADFPDPEGILGSLFRSTSPGNHTGYRNADVDAALAAAATEKDPARRMATYRQVEERILADHPAIPLYHSVNYLMVKPYVSGLKVTPLGLLNFKDVTVEGR
ncbi:MAG TPA: peptide ABC transporter substrate-binding protein [Chloroflexia bacterium]|nr:peptide ABC transporter substrate-binding protein [Chloroflexia bacterium]